jgi:uncharacterized membrane protein
MKEAENWERFLVDYGFIPSRKERIIRWLIALTINIVWLFFVYKCFENKNYPLGIVLSIAYIGWKIVKRGND